MRRRWSGSPSRGALTARSRAGICGARCRTSPPKSCSRRAGHPAPIGAPPCAGGPLLYFFFFEPFFAFGPYFLRACFSHATRLLFFFLYLLRQLFSALERCCAFESFLT